MIRGFFSSIALSLCLAAAIALAAFIPLLVMYAGDPERTAGAPVRTLSIR